MEIIVNDDESQVPGTTVGGMPQVKDEVTTLLRASFDPSPAPEPFRVVVIAGPEAGQSFELDASLPSRVLIGQSEACTVRFSDRTVSRRHVALEPEGKRVRLVDLGSKNGTRVNGLWVTEAMLEGGERIEVGSTIFQLERTDHKARFQLSTASHFGRVIGASTEMRRLYPLCEKLAKSDVAVIIEGETGTGKELLAESLHEQGARADKPFVVLDCTAVPPNLLEAELFGHEKGAFTGAVMARRGVFEQAHGGTLLIDEIGDLDLTLQPKLLRAIERQEIRPIGSNQSIRVDVRVIAATRRDLDREVQAGRFRDDLLHRLAVARIELPPLRRRRGDVSILVQHFAKQLGGDAESLPRDLCLSWEEHSWPGNVRELRNTVARHLALGELANLDLSSGGGAADEDEAQDVIESVMSLPLGEARAKVVEQFERRYVERMLARHGGNVTRAAETAGVARRYFQIIKARAARRRKGQDED